MDKEIKDKVKSDILDFIDNYQKKLWINGIKSVEPIGLITINDVRYYLNYKWIKYKEFKDLIDNDDDLSSEMKQFLTNNFIHFASSTKMKDLLIDYKDSIVQLDSNQFEFDFTKINSFVSKQMQSKYEISLNCDAESDVDQDDAKRILKTVETY